MDHGRQVPPARLSRHPPQHHHHHQPYFGQLLLYLAACLFVNYHIILRSLVRSVAHTKSPFCNATHVSGQEMPHFLLIVYYCLCTSWGSVPVPVVRGTIHNWHRPGPGWDLDPSRRLNHGLAAHEDEWVCLVGVGVRCPHPRLRRVYGCTAADVAGSIIDQPVYSFWQNRRARGVKPFLAGTPTQPTVVMLWFDW